ncbi:diacylglycerol kinase [Acinetobacter apis]|uniref:Diacylglycerol kinase n=1 Tax=Acinetobacter apis TaxID=1229165 RepID=A0A217EID4_9GAMM|nr:diacylglycerol kinase [Acinetobacter apis]SNQ30117.1 diacylglycerol kinase (ATP) [Acinetobacter apis]
MTIYSPLKGKTGYKRIFNALFYSISGLRCAFKYEAAFRQIILLNVFLIPLSLCLDISKVEHILLIIIGLNAIVIELFNSAIEAAIDRISLEHHPLSKIAKDMGSAAQLIALLIICVGWAGVLLF